jgi:putative lipoic acid-binding regulatory protein
MPLYEKTAGSFFNPVPEDNHKEKNDESDNPLPPTFEESVEDLLRRRKKPPRASQPSTIDGVPTHTVGQGFGNTPVKTTKSSSKPFVGIGPASVNDITNPETDDQGYTLYADEVTGKKSRVFEALVEYPCEFTLKIVGANEGLFVEEMVAVVAEACEVTVQDVSHSVRMVGKWTSVTVKAPVQSAAMLYALYETVDRDPRVRFKF